MSITSRGAAANEFFDKACELDLEGIIAKRKESRYRVTEKPSPHWIKSRTGITVRPRAARNCSSGRKCGGFERLISGHAPLPHFQKCHFPEYRNTRRSHQPVFVDG